MTGLNDVLADLRALPTRGVTIHTDRLIYGVSIRGGALRDRIGQPTDLARWVRRRETAKLPLRPFTAAALDLPADSVDLRPDEPPDFPSFYAVPGPDGLHRAQRFAAYAVATDALEQALLILGENRGGRQSVITEMIDPGSDQITSGTLAKALEMNDGVVMDVIQRAAYHLGVFTGSLVNALDPECIVYGGGLIEACGAIMLPIIRETTYRYLLRPVDPEDLPILQAALGDNAVLIGAAMLAANSILEAQGR